MLNFKKSIIVTILFVILLAIQNSVFASGINMNLSNEANAIQNSTTTNTAITSAVVSTVESTTETQPAFGVNTILDILLIAIGLVIILLAIAILIRLKH